MNENDRKFKKQMINDMFEILGNEKISNASKKHILDMYCWILTERKGNKDESKNAKFKGCDYWSKAALERLDDNTTEKNNYESGLRHEHVVPRKLFRKYVDNVCKNWSGMDQTDKNKIIEKINNFFIGCVVTKEEADDIDNKYKDKFPDEDKNTSLADITKKNLWDRYKNTIPKPEILKVEWESKSRGWEKTKETGEVKL